MKLKRLYRNLKQLVGKNAFSKTKRQGLSGKEKFAEKVKKMKAEIDSHARTTKVKSLLLAGHPSVLPKGFTTDPLEAAVLARDIIQDHAFKEKLLKKPKTLKMLALHFKGTKLGNYFAQLECQAFVKKQSPKVRKILERQAEIGRIDKNRRH